MKRQSRVSSLQLALLCGCGSAALIAPMALATEAPVIEEILVTAQKRQENLQDVPISAQVVGGQQLQQENRTSLESLTQTIPGVRVTQDAFSNNFYVRGVGSGGNNPSFDQAVATFVDDIYHGRSKMSEATFLDLDRVEFLKGPQSTFFGNNAIAGALNIVTKKPGDRFEAWARALYGMHGQYALEGAAGGPINTKFGVRAAATYNGGDGWIENVSTGKLQPKVSNLAGRVIFAFNPTENLDATLKIEGSRHKTSGSYTGQPQQRADCPPPAPLTPGNILGCAQALTFGSSIPFGIENNLTTGLPGAYHTLSSFEDVLTINYHKWGHTFTSVTGFNNYHVAANIDQSQLPENLIATSRRTEKYHQFSQELRIASPVDQPVEYMVGGYVQNDHLTFDHDIALPLFNFLPLLGPPFDQLGPYLPLASSVGMNQHEDIYSVFGSLTWNVTSRLKLNAGVRGSWVEKEATVDRVLGTGTLLYGGFVPAPDSIQSLIGAFFGAPSAPNLTRSDHAWMPSAGVQYKLAPEAMVYFSYSRGFKAGGFNGSQTFGALENLAYGPEHVNAYELGIKSKWFADRVLVNLSVFRSDYTDLQVNAAITNPATNIYTVFVQNAAASRSQGVELEAQAALTKSFRLSANVTYLDSTFVSYPQAPATLLQTFCSGLTLAQYSGTSQCARFPFPVQANFANLTGQRTPFAPEWSGSISADYSIVLPGEYKFTTQLSSYFTSSYTIDSTDPEGVFPRLGNYVRLDARITIESPDRNWAFDVIGHNLTNETILTSRNTKEEPWNVAGQVRFNW